MSDIKVGDRVLVRGFRNPRVVTGLRDGEAVVSPTGLAYSGVAVPLEDCALMDRPERAESLAAGGEAKPERRGWVPCAAGDDIRGAYLRCDGFLWRARGDRWFQTSGAPRTERWCGCPNPLCTREEPHEIGIVECRMPPSAMAPGVSMEVVYGDPSVPQVTEDVDALGMGGGIGHDDEGSVSRWSVDKTRERGTALAIELRVPNPSPCLLDAIRRPYTPLKVTRADEAGGERLRIAPDVIHTEAQLVRALFIAMNEAEVVRRCELREAGENMRNLLTERCSAVVTTMMADPAYAKERQAAERLASRTWSARRVF